MREYIGLFLGFLALGIGGMKTALHMASAQTLEIAGCLGGTFTLTLGQTSAHCWGCYIAGAGLLLVMSVSLRHAWTALAPTRRNVLR